MLTAANVTDIVIAKLHDLNVTEVTSFAGLAAKEEELNEFFDTLKLGEFTPENTLALKVSVRRNTV